jgi:hypothetical protein
MGMDRTIRFPTAPIPAWDAIRANLVRVGEGAQLRMIDGLPAFPDEVPEPGWRELRVGLAAGMATVRSGPGVLTCVVWGNADPELRSGWDKLCWACAAAGGGVVEVPSGPLPATEFARSVGLPPV